MPTTQDRIAELAVMDDDDFLDAVEDYVLGDTAAVPADHDVFRSPELVERTRDALTVLISIFRAFSKQAPARSAERRDALDKMHLLAAQRTIIGPIIKTVVEERRRAENPGLQRRAWEELARRYPQEYMAIKKQLRAEAGQ